MTPQQILDRVQGGADARIGETIERLLFLLSEQAELYSNSDKHLWKWMQTGLLQKIAPDERPFASVLLEQRARELVGEWSRLPVGGQNSMWEAYATKELKQCVNYLLCDSPRNT